VLRTARHSWSCLSTSAGSKGVHQNTWLLPVDGHVLRFMRRITIITTHGYNLDLIILLLHMFAKYFWSVRGIRGRLITEVFLEDKRFFNDIIPGFRLFPTTIGSSRSRRSFGWFLKISRGYSSLPMIITSRASTTRRLCLRNASPLSGLALRTRELLALDLWRPFQVLYG
jgi:hypothetical protein